MITWLIVAGLAGFLIGAFLEEIMNWAKDVLNRLSSVARKAGVYIKRVPGAVKVFVKTLLGKQETTKSELTREDIEQMVRDGVITREQADDLLNGLEVHIGNIERDN